MKDKSLIRNEIRLKRQMLTTVENVEMSKRITQRILKLPEYINAKTVCIYSSLLKEVQTDELIEISIQLKKHVCVPKMNHSNLTFHSVSSLSDLYRSEFGIREPNSSCIEVFLERIDVFIVPGLAFDRKGARVGLGKGYYDKVLEHTKAFKLGICFGFQIVTDIPKEVHDIVMNGIVTEEEVIQIHECYE